MTVAPRPVSSGPYRICWTIDDWVQACREAADSNRWGLDFETRPKPGFIQATDARRAEDGSEICGIGIAWLTPDRVMKSAYVGIKHDSVNAGGVQPNARQVIRVLSDSIVSRPRGHLMVVANLAMELSFMLAEGICWPPEGDIHDVQVAARVLNKGHGFKELIGLKVMQQHILKKDMESKNDMDRWLMAHKMKPGRDIWRAPVALAGRYCEDDARDALQVFLMWEHLVVQPPTRWWWSRPPNRLERQDLYELEIEVAIQSMLAGIRGTKVDVALTDRRAKAAQALQDVCAKWIREHLDMPALNPGSQTQLRAILFGPMGFKVHLAHLTESFLKLKDREQTAVLADKTGQKILDYASLDIEALDHYAVAHPEHSDLIFILAVYRKCQTALTWFKSNVEKHTWRKSPDPWWQPDEAVLLDVIFHRLRSVGTLSGRMSSSDYNAQQIAKRFKMLIAADRLMTILEAFLPASQLAELRDMMDYSTIKTDDESKSAHLPIDSPVLDFSIKSMFVARPGMNMASHDLSQVEMRGFAHFSGNKLLCEGYGKPMSDDDVSAALAVIVEFMETGAITRPVDWDYHSRLEANPFDIHRFVAHQIEISRKEAKGVNFGIVYGMGKRKLARERGWTPEQGIEYLARYYAQFPEIIMLQEQIKIALRKRGYIFDPYGRRYYLGPDRAYVGLNRLIQGWAAGVFKVGVARVCGLLTSMGDRRVHPVTRRMMPTGPKMLTCVHDDLQSEIPRELDDSRLDWMMRTSMTAINGLKVPLGASSERSPDSLDNMRVVA